MRYRLLAHLAVSSALLIARDLHSQSTENPSPVFNWFEPISRVAAVWPDGYLYDAQPTAPLYLHSNAPGIFRLSKQTADYNRGGCGEINLGWWRPRIAPPRLLGRGDRSALACTHVFVPRFHIRQLEDSSSAVSPPSFNPYYEFAITQASLSGKAEDPITSRKGGFAQLRLRLAHYSNGQAGCTYEGEERVDKDEPCIPIGAPNPVRLNTTNGDFSTTYLEVGYGFGGFGLHRDGSVRSMWQVDLSMTQHATQHNALQFLWGAMTESQRRTYGVNELGLQLRKRWLVFRPLCSSGSRFRGVSVDLEANGAVATKRADGFERERWDVVAGVSFARLQGLGLGYRLSGGFDPYNLAYGRRVDGRGALLIQFDRRTHAERFTVTGTRSTTYLC